MVVAVTASITTITAVIVASRLARMTSLRERRYEAYRNIYEIVVQITTSAINHAYTPGLSLEDDPERRLERRANTEMLLIGSKKARQAYLEWRDAVLAYWPSVHMAAAERRKYDQLVEAHDQGERRDEDANAAYGRAETMRIELGGPMVRIQEAADRLENVLRTEVTGRSGRQPRV